MRYDYWDLETHEGLNDYELHARYDDFLDEFYGQVTLAGEGYWTSNLLRDSDPIAYEENFYNWLDSKLGETITQEEPEK